MTDDLNALADRCEAATGPDRELDAAIVSALGIIARCWCSGVCKIAGQVCVATPKFSASLDAALTLVPDRCGECNIQLGEPGEQHGAWITLQTKHCSHCGQHTTPTVRGDAATPALALCAASLRARANG